MENINKKISCENWEGFLYKTSNLLTFISIGAEYDKNQVDSINFIYNVVTSDYDFKEKYQKTFSGLEEAILHINTKCLNWDFTPKGLINKEGCDSCGAH
jgi:hypothetical protein